MTESASVSKWRKTMEQVGEDGLTGFQRRGRNAKITKLANDPDYYKKWSQRSLATMGPDGLKSRGQKITQSLGTDGLKARGQAVKKSLIESGNMDIRSKNSAAAIRAKMKPVDEQKSLKRYRNRVSHLSRKHDLSDLPNYELWGEAGGYELDHKYSISEGWKNKIPPEIMAMKHNLQFLEKIPNIKKGKNCEITLAELLTL